MKKTYKRLKQNKLWKLWKQENGVLTLEATISLTAFIICILTVINFFNYCRVQALVSNAVDTATREIAQYAYVMQIGDSKEQKDTIIDTLGSLYSGMEQSGETLLEDRVSAMEVILNTLGDDATAVQTCIKQIENAFGEIQENPLVYMRAVAAITGEDALPVAQSRAIAAPLAKALVAQSFGTQLAEADEKLEELGVVNGLDGMNFNLSTIFSEEEPEDVHIVVYYKMKMLSFLDYEYGNLVICEESRARAWLGGDNP